MKAWTFACILPVLMVAGVCQAAEPVPVAGVIDGETLQLAGGEKARLAGIDVPASSRNAKLRDDIKSTGKVALVLIAAGKNASKFLRNLLKNEKVIIEYDGDRKDKFGRRQAYVYLYLDPNRNMEIPEEWYAELSPEPGERQLRVFLNATMIRSGYARVMTLPPDTKHQELFLKLEKEAQEKKRGLWG